MPIVPAGLPAWTRTAHHTTYGGDVNKRNYMSQGAIDPLTDVTAEQLVRIAADLAAAVRTAPFAVLTLTLDDVTPGPPTVESCLLMTGAQTTPYVGNAPPTGFPAVTRIGAGHARITFAASYLDPYAVEGDFDIRQHKAGGHDGAAATTLRVSATVLDVFVSGGDAATVTVWT
jgi:hypothetical protein